MGPSANIFLKKCLALEFQSLGSHIQSSNIEAGRDKGSRFISINTVEFKNTLRMSTANDHDNYSSKRCGKVVILFRILASHTQQLNCLHQPKLPRITINTLGVYGG